MKLNILILLSQIKDANKAANDTKDLAKVLQDRIAENLDSFEREKNKTKELIQKVKNYLMGQYWADAVVASGSVVGLLKDGGIHPMTHCYFWVAVD